MYKLFDIIRAVRAILQPYVVSVYWDGDFYIHKAWTSSDGLEWCKMYPPSATCSVYTRINMQPIMRVGHL